MPPESRSIAHVVEALQLEFDGRVPASTVTEVVRGLSRDGATSLDRLARRARLELVALSLRTRDPES